MNEKHLIGLMSPTCLALMTGLMWMGNATPGAFALVGLGGGDGRRLRHLGILNREIDL